MKRIVSLAAALGVVVAAAVVTVVAASFAIYAAARDAWGPAPAAALVAGLFAITAVLAAVLAVRRAAPSKSAAPPQSLADRAIGMAKDRPILALGAAAVVITVALRNPAVVNTLVNAFVAGATKPPARR